MRFFALPLILFGLAAPCLSAEQNRLTIQWFELDSTQQPELTKKLASSSQVKNSDTVLTELRECEPARLMVQHELSVTPGSRVNQSTKMDDTTFKLNLEVQPADQKSYTFHVTSSLETLAPGKDIARRTTIRKVDSAFKLSPGTSFVLTGLERSGRERAITQVLVVRLQGLAEEQTVETVQNGLEPHSSPKAALSTND
ncbi:hypothetical protein [Rhodopirellula baltica]|uniref:Uncharacterized protein n=1 Tax=Rhodopirellula baltica WH47 TaxID=991778 RepID=F2ATQ5_RHOBT|nr:hypothetical protein [Rhodopirellula baltica]EGF26889.1 hypothetical protein RBWH47_03928 [Rhodopirellula baltica WH47]